MKYLFNKTKWDQETQWLHMDDTFEGRVKRVVADMIEECLEPLEDDTLPHTEDETQNDWQWIANRIAEEYHKHKGLNWPVIAAAKIWSEFVHKYPNTPRKPQ